MALMTSAERSAVLGEAQRGIGPTLASSGMAVRRHADGHQLDRAMARIAQVADLIPGVDLRGPHGSRPLDFLVVGTRELDVKGRNLSILPIVNKLVELVPSLAVEKRDVVFDDYSIQYVKKGTELYIMLHPSEQGPQAQAEDLYQERLNTIGALAELSIAASVGAFPEREPDMTVLWYGGGQMNEGGINGLCEVVEEILPFEATLWKARFPVRPTVSMHPAAR